MLNPEKGVYCLNLAPHGHQNKDKMLGTFSNQECLLVLELYSPGRHRQWRERAGSEGAGPPQPLWGGERNKITLPGVSSALLHPEATSQQWWGWYRIATYSHTHMPPALQNRWGFCLLLPVKYNHNSDTNSGPGCRWAPAAGSWQDMPRGRNTPPFLFTVDVFHHPHWTTMEGWANV